MKMCLFLIPVLLLLIACSTEKSATPLEKIENIRVTAKPAAAELMQQLKGALIRTIEDSGIVAAIKVCKNMAPEISKTVAQNLPQVAEVGRTSLNLRNISNSPDATDLSALRYFENQIHNEQDSLSVDYIVDDGKYYRYYQPILIQPLCLNCHGNKSIMQIEVISAIEKNYPQDKAVGYNINDLRGLIRVKIPKDFKSS